MPVNIIVNTVLNLQENKYVNMIIGKPREQSNALCVVQVHMKANILYQVYTLVS
jgi:hypothetical protein